METSDTVTVTYTMRYEHSSHEYKTPNAKDIERYVSKSADMMDLPSYLADFFTIICPVKYIGNMGFTFTCKPHASLDRIAYEILEQTLADFEWEGSFVIGFFSFDKVEFKTHGRTVKYAPEELTRLRQRLGYDWY